MKSINRKHMIWMAILVLLLVYFSENIYGYYRFKQYCWNEGGLRVYEKLEKNEIWLADDKFSAKSIAIIPYVGISKFLNEKNNQLYDVFFLGGKINKRSSYSIKPSGNDQPVKYFFKSKNIKVADEIRLKKVSYIVKRSVDEKLMLEFNSFYYSRLNKKNTILGAPSISSCHNVDLIKRSLKNIFK